MYSIYQDNFKNIYFLINQLINI